jgi:hypothetical protein
MITPRNADDIAPLRFCHSGSAADSHKPGLKIEIYHEITKKRESAFPKWDTDKHRCTQIRKIIFKVKKNLCISVKICVLFSKYEMD